MHWSIRDCMYIKIYCIYTAKQLVVTELYLIFAWDGPFDFPGAEIVLKKNFISLLDLKN